MNFHRKAKEKKAGSGQNMENSSLFRTYQGTQVEYKYVNNNAKDSIVFINGCGTTFEFEWRKQHDFGGNKYNLLFHNSPGMGKSSVLFEKNYLDQAATSAGQLCKHLGIERPHIVAHSMGGLILPRFLEIGNLDALGIVLVCTIDGNPLHNEPWSRIKINYEKIVESYSQGNLGKIAKTMENEFAEYVFYQISKIIKAGLDKESFEVLYRNFIQNRPAVGSALLDIFQNGDRIGNEIEKISNPTLVIGGRQDFIVSPNVARRISKKIKNSQLEIFENSAHAPMISEADKLNRLVSGFLVSI